jgi:Uma2 family endonuclease
VRSGAEIKIPQQSNSRNPDLLICTEAQWQVVRSQTKAEFLTGNPPLMTVEVVSPGNPKKDTQDLVVEYANAQIQEYWIVNPIDEVVSIYVLDGQAYLLKGKYRGEQLVESELLTHWNATAAEMLC